MIDDVRASSPSNETVLLLFGTNASSAFTTLKPLGSAAARHAAATLLRSAGAQSTSTRSSFSSISVAPASSVSSNGISNI